MWTGRRCNNNRPGGPGVPDFLMQELGQDGRRWDSPDSPTKKTSVEDHILVMKRRINGKQPRRHLAHDPELVAGPELWSLLNWFGFWRGDLRSVAPPCELRQMLRLLDRRCLPFSISITKRVRPGVLDRFNMAYQHLDRYLTILESRLRPAAVREVVASDEIMQVCLAFMGPQTVGAACCASRRFRKLADSEEVWRDLLRSHWPASQALCQSRGSKACYAYRVQLTRDAAQRCYERDHIGIFDEDDPVEWMSEQAAKYQLMIEMMVDQRVLLASTLDLSYDPVDEDICALVPESCHIPPTAFWELEERLRMTLTLVRKDDGKCLVVGDGMDFTTILDNGHVLVSFGSSPIKRTHDELLYVLSKHPLCNLLLRHRTEHWFLHEVTFEPTIREEDDHLVGISRISIGLHGVCSQSERARRFPGIAFATWDELAIWA